MSSTSGILWRLTGVRLYGPALRLDCAELEIPTGVTVLLGSSGAGKSSLLNLLVRFELPARGEVLSVLATTPGYEVGWVPQCYSLWPQLTVAEHVQFVLPSPGDRSAVKVWLTEWDLWDHSGKRPQQLSAGQQARLAIVRALASAAKVLVMDEPLAHVEASRESYYRERIAAHIASTGRSLVFASHNIESVYRLAQHVICLQQGCVAYQGPLASLYAAPLDRQQAEFLGPVNWFEPHEAVDWLGEPQPKRMAVRPEQLVIEHVPASPLRVESWRFLGSSAVAMVRHVDSQECRELRYCPPAPLLIGQFVRLRSRDVGYPHA